MVATALLTLFASASFLTLERHQARDAATAAVAGEAALTGRQYALTRTSLALSMQRWKKALSSASSDAPSLQAALESLPLSAGDWLVLADVKGAPLAIRGLNANQWQAVREQERFVQLGGDTYIVDSANVTSAYALYGALNLTARLGALEVTADAPSSGSVTASGTPQVILDQAGSRRLSVPMPSDQVAPMPFPWIFALASVALALVMTLAWLWRLVLRRAMARYWQRELAPLVDALRRVREGNCAQPMRTNPEHPLSDIALEFNAMQDDVDERQSRLDYQSQFDALTGLITRAVANERIAAAVDRATFANQTLAAVAIDVSRFNEINGTLGQEVGDLVLKELAQRLSSNTRVTDTVARVGGDEFMLLLDDVDEQTALQLVEFLVQTLESPIVVQQTSIKLKIRAGLALFPDHAEGARALRRMSNIALMTAKEAQSKVLMYAPGQDEKQLRELAIIHDLPTALREGELYLQYQPKIDVDTQRVETVEALVRWRHPQLGFIPPDEFIGLIERAGQITQLTDWVFKAAVRQLRDWNMAGYDLGVAVNISAHDLRDENLPARIQALLQHYVVKPSRLSIEVTESAVIDDPERAVAVLQAFRDAGLKIALDDFGTGQTSLSLLKQLPLSQVKIDKSFVQHLRADSGDAIIVKSIIDLGHNMGLLVTAEGVESNYCWNLLRSYNCDLVQGYLVSAPLTADELCKWYLRLQDRHVNKLDYTVLQNAG